MAHIKDNSNSNTNENNNSEGKSFNMSDAKLDLKELRNQYNKIANEILEIKNKATDKRDLSSEDRNKARNLYIRLGEAASRIAQY